MDEFRLTLSRSLGMVLLLTIPSSVGLAVLGPSMIGAVYQWGRFRAADTHQTAHGAGLLRRGPGGLLGHQDSGAGLLRARTTRARPCW